MTDEQKQKYRETRKQKYHNKELKKNMKKHDQ